MTASSERRVERFRYEAPTLDCAAEQARYRDLTLPLYDAHVLDPSRGNHVEMVHLHRLILVHGQVAPVRNERSSARVRSDGVDQVIATLILEGETVMEIEGRRRIVPGGRVQLYDLARVAAHEGNGAPSISLVIPRDMIEAILSDLGPLHGMVLDRMNDMVVQHLRSLVRHGAQLSEPTAAGVARATVELLCAAVQASPEAQGAASGAPAHVMRDARAYIAERLCGGDITPGELARAISVSRTRLYEAFAPYGGVSNYIRDSRLRAIRRALLDPKERRRVGELAFAYGFKSEAHFSRSFRELFGVAPLSLRTEPKQGGEPAVRDLNGAAVRRWLRD
ncbi:MAG: helix-turn-helix transcriptional regulator [Acetobacteraceae bacterium]|nr:helix-turn-helix transcriptional regulator [Acetobacteraceae bacterium]